MSGMRWSGVAGGYEVAVRGQGGDEPAVACRKAGGKELAKVPAKVKKDPAVVSLAELCERLAEHGRTVRRQVEDWMLRSLPVPVGVLHAVWEDPAWRHALTDLVVAPVRDGTPDLERCGVLRDLDASRGVQVVPLDGDAVWSDAGTFAIPHPVLLGDRLDDWLRRGAMLRSDQAVEQLRRDRWSRPAGMDRTIGVIDAFWFTEARWDNGGAFERRVIELGGRVRGEAARFTVHDPEPLGVELEVKYSGPMSPAYLGTLTFANGEAEIGEIAWSEATRILMSLFEGRTVEDDGTRVLGTAEVYADYCDRHRGEPGVLRPSRGRTPSREVLSRAGAVLPGPPASADEDVMVAASFTHPALDEPVVSLVRRAAVAAERASMALQGLVAAGESTLGAVHAGPLGFVAAALNRYPAHRNRIVALQPVLHAARKTAAGKPGLARNTLQAPADDLAAHAPELLPLFFEECARMMAAAGSTKYAAAYFEKARAAESDHALPVDEAELVAAYVAAGSGAVGSATLKRHADRLAKRHSPDDACRWQRRLLTEWCEAGEDDALILAAGWARAARAAKWKPGERAAPAERAADERAVRALLGHGCLRTAPAAIWTFIRPLLFRMARGDAGVRDRLVESLPEPADDGPEAKAAAVSVLIANLDGAGAKAPFTSGTRLSGTRVRDWVGRFMNLYAGLALPVTGLADLLRDAGARLTAEGLTCDGHTALLGPDDNSVSFYMGELLEEHTDYRFPLLELALRCGLPLAPPRNLHTFKLHHWLETAERPDLTATAADPHWGPLLRGAVIGNVTVPLSLGPPAHELQIRPATVKNLVEAPGTREIVADILAGHAERVPGQGLPDVHAALCDVERFTVAGVPEAARESVRAIVAEADPVRPLAATLRGGVLNELDLEALSRYERYTAHGYMEESGTDLLVIEAGRLWGDAFRASAVTPEGVGPCQTFGNYDDFNETAHKKAEARELYDRCLIVVDGRVTVLDHGGPHCPHGGSHPNAPSVRPVDGEQVRFPGAGSAATVWRGEGRLIELRDATGRTIGRYVRGSGWVPEHDRADPARIHFHRYASGFGLVPPPGWWSRMTPRDPEGSRALRRVDDESARLLLEAADASLAARIMKMTAQDADWQERYACFDELKARLGTLLPEVTDETLRIGVTSIVWTAVECRERVFALARRLGLAPPPHLPPAPATAVVVVAETPKPRESKLGFLDSEPERIQARSTRALVGARLVRLAKETVPEHGSARPGAGGLDSGAIAGVEERLGRLGASVLRTAWATGTERDRRRKELLDLASVPELIRTDGTWQVARICPHVEAGRPYAGFGAVAIIGIGPAEESDVGWARVSTALLHTPDGPDPLIFSRNRVQEVRICRGWGDPDRLRAAADLIGRNGPPALGRQAVIAAFAEATGLSTAQAIVLLSPSARGVAWPLGWAPGRVTPLHPDDAELVRAHNLTRTELKAAALTLQAMADSGEAIDLVEALMPDDPADLWRSGPDVERAISRWSGRHPRLTPLASELWVTLTSGLDERDLPLLSCVTALLGERLPERPAAHPGRFGEAARLLADGLPPDHPARDTVAARLRDLHAACTAPRTRALIATGVASVDALEQAVGSLAVHLPDHGELAISDLLTLAPGGDGYRVRLHPSRLTGPDDPRLERLGTALARSGAANVQSVLSDLRFLLSDACAQATDPSDAATLT
ncbi:hypothetical protein GCM10023085_63120 [Actinomadura viridis]|uniref:DUF4132 domain-containing protein n=2 Tax=Actinomadura viridis TaxID=58110 RepID=A0A931DCP2_9ACTN|nr:hypothetical protein [Actinomadura viridis]